MSFPRIASLKTHQDLLARLEELGIDLPCDEQSLASGQSPFAENFEVEGRQIGNRFCILPMEGWDGTADGRPSDLTIQRWRNFGLSGAKLIWGGEAVAVRHDGRANPNQLMINDQNLQEIESLRAELISTHHERFGALDDLLVGLQLTHSGRFARPNDRAVAEPLTVQRNPCLDARLSIVDDSTILSDDELHRLIDQFIIAAGLAAKAGFHFVDIKHCHGYLGHELLSGYDRPGQFGGSFENRTRFLREIVSGIRAQSPSLMIGVRLSVFDFIPFRPGPDQIGVPESSADARLAFGGDASGQKLDLREPAKFIELLQELGIRLICTTAGSPYYNPHIQRPAYFPPCDGYQPPEDPLVGVARQIHATAALKQQYPEQRFVGSGYSYLQDWLPHVGQAVVRAGMVDSVGLGRMVLSYPDLPADVLEGKLIMRKKICRTFSDCTTAPRNGLVSGCYPLDPFYKRRPERDVLKQLKQDMTTQ
ncbi:MAG: NADH:flavin oxidoreductase [Planctomycetota bacterium]|nr:NADH:flavin oxidoreductase [Planctomycetota bacterium]